MCVLLKCNALASTAKGIAADNGCSRTAKNVQQIELSVVSLLPVALALHTRLQPEGQTFPSTCSLGLAVVTLLSKTGAQVGWEKACTL